MGKCGGLGEKKGKAIDAFSKKVCDIEISYSIIE